MTLEIKFNNGTVDTVKVRQVAFKDGILKVSLNHGELFEIYREEFESIKIKESNNMADNNRADMLNTAKRFIKDLEKDLKRYASENLTTDEYIAVVEIREACNRIIEDELCRG